MVDHCCALNGWPALLVQQSISCQSLKMRELGRSTGDWLMEELRRGFRGARGLNKLMLTSHGFMNFCTLTALPMTCKK